MKLNAKTVILGALAAYVLVRVFRPGVVGAQALPDAPAPDPEIDTPRDGGTAPVGIGGGGSSDAFGFSFGGTDLQDVPVIAQPIGGVKSALCGTQTAWLSEWRKGNC